MGVVLYSEEMSLRRAAETPLQGSGLSPPVETGSLSLFERFATVKSSFDIQAPVL
jgi:hypothetical protein